MCLDPSSQQARPDEPRFTGDGQLVWPDAAFLYNYAALIFVVRRRNNKICNTWLE